MMTRRDLMVSAGASLVAAPFLSLLSGTARAQDAMAPAKRLMIFFSPDGMVPHLWSPLGDENNFRFGDDSVLTPLTDYRDDLLILEGIDILTGTNHEGGMGAMLTNYNRRGADLPLAQELMPEDMTRIPPNENEMPLANVGDTNGSSVDQVIARHIGADDRFASMAFGILTDPWGASIQTRMNYSGPGQYVHPDADPRSVFRRMFGGISRDEHVLENLRLRRRSILDIVLGDLNNIRGRVGAQERAKFDRHLQAIRAVERSLFPENPADCEVPAAPGRMNKDDYALVPQLTRAQIDLAITALACEMTKVTTVQLSHTVSPVVFSWVGNTDGHHDLSHAPNDDALSLAQLVAADRWCAEQFAYIIDQLKATPNPDGEGTLFDDTLVVWVKELGDSRLHVCESVPFICAGTAGGALRPGRYLRYDHVPHSKLLVSMCQAFGMELETFGDPATGRGGLGRLV